MIGNNNYIHKKYWNEDGSLDKEEYLVNGKQASKAEWKEAEKLWGRSFSINYPSSIFKSCILHGLWE